MLMDDQNDNNNDNTVKPTVVTPSKDLQPQNDNNLEQNYTPAGINSTADNKVNSASTEVSDGTVHGGPAQVSDAIRSQINNSNEFSKAQESTSNPKVRNKVGLGKYKKIILVVILVVGFMGAVSAAYFLGKSNEKVIVKAPDPKPINLPPQAVVIEECKVNRGKQYILPKDIPVGPIYNVVNSQVIAIEYNLNIGDLQSDPNSLSNTILQLAREYPVDHFSFSPVQNKAGEALQNVSLVMFVVSKEEVKKIACD